MSDARPYVDAWLAREPGMDLARVFCPPAQRAPFEQWGALLHQLDEAAFELSDPNVARTKLAWWGEELATMSSRTSRHPLARALSGHEALRAVPAPDWVALVHAAMLAGDSDRPPAETSALLAQGAPYARLTARIESLVFAGAAPHSAHADAIAVHHVLRRLEHSLGRDAAVFPWPMHLRARHQAPAQVLAEFGVDARADAALADLANELLAPVDRLRGGPLFRRCQSALDAQRLQALGRRRLERLRANGAGTLWTLWRAARRRA